MPGPTSCLSFCSSTRAKGSWPLGLGESAGSVLEPDATWFARRPFLRQCPVRSVQRDTIPILEEEPLCVLLRLHPEAKPVRSGTHGLRQLVAGGHPAAHPVVGHDRGSERRLAQGALGAHDVAKKA